MAGMNAFTLVEETWRQRLRMLPNTVRQELVSRQLAAHLPAAPARVLDVGCGQGSQALRLAEQGYEIIGVDHSAEMLTDFEAALAEKGSDVRRRVRLVQGDAAQLPDEVTARGGFDAVLCHGVLMYLSDPMPALSAMRDVLSRQGILSLLVRNAAARALHAGLRGDWAEADTALLSTTYTNRLGVEARADRIGDLIGQCSAFGMPVRQWYGVLTFAEFAAMESPVPDPGEFARIVACEERAGRTEPYRQISAMLHVVASPSQAYAT